MQAFKDNHKKPASTIKSNKEKWYTAEEIAAILGITAEEVDRIAEANGIKPPIGESNEFGRWIYSKR